MKKNVFATFVLLSMVLVILVHFVGCDKLKVSYLRGNYYLKQANRYYQEEVYRKAIEAYETALSYNPNLKMAYIYLGTSYSQVYRPMKEDERNKRDGEKAEEYLLKAMEYEPDREEVVIALGDLYDKMGNFEKAEEYYRIILEKKKSELDSIKKEAEDSQDTTAKSQQVIAEKMEGVVKAYYTLANFYEKNGRTDLAEEMYKQRIALDPKDPEGYHYYVGFLQNQRRWEEAITNHEKRLYSMLDPDIIDILNEIDQLQVDTEEVKKTTEFIDTVKKNRRVGAEEKQRLIAEAEERIKGKLPVEEAEKKLEELKQELEKKIKRAEALADTLEEEEKQKVAETYYSIGNVCWNWSYQTPMDFMAPEQRKSIIEKGLSSLEKATTLAPDYADPYAYMGLLWREMIKVEPLKRDEFVKKNEEYNKKFTDIYKRKKRQEEYKKQLEEMGQEQ
ncbi:MAG: tetratricopeptide repeat protein [Candidatus Aminicenantes bacterium]|jgi:tetratricopeptide (TPR) repeat protein